MQKLYLSLFIMSVNAYLEIKLLKSEKLLVDWNIEQKIEQTVNCMCHVLLYALFKTVF